MESKTTIINTSKTKLIFINYCLHTCIQWIFSDIMPNHLIKNFLKTAVIVFLKRAKIFWVSNFRRVCIHVISNLCISHLTDFLNFHFPYCSKKTDHMIKESCLVHRMEFHIKYDFNTKNQYKHIYKAVYQQLY